MKIIPGFAREMVLPTALQGRIARGIKYAGNNGRCRVRLKMSLKQYKEIGLSVEYLS